MKILDENNVQLIGELSVGWKEDRTLESRAAEQDLVFIKALENLLEQTEKRKNKVGSVVYQLLGELQQLKYYLEGMSDPVATAKVEETIEGRKKGHNFFLLENLFFFRKSWRTKSVEFEQKSVAESSRTKIDRFSSRLG